MNIHLTKRFPALVFCFCAGIFSSAALFAATDYTGFLKGVSFTENHGYYDYNKRAIVDNHEIPGPGIRGVDSELCWAASASNILQWWQTTILENSTANYQSSPGNPINAPYQFEATYRITEQRNTASNIFGLFVNNWSDNPSNASNGFRWFINNETKTVNGVKYGVDYSAGSSWLYNGAAEAGFYNGQFKCTSKPLLVNTSTFTKFVRQSLEKDIGMTLGIKQTYNGQIQDVGHAITLWGYSFENGKNYIYITDSDDSFSGMRKHLITQIRMGGKQYWAINDYNGTSSWVVAFAETLSMQTVKKVNGRVDFKSPTNARLTGSMGADADDEIGAFVYDSGFAYADSVAAIDIDYFDLADMYVINGDFLKGDDWVENVSKLYFDFLFEDDTIDFFAAMVEERAEVTLIAFSGVTDLTVEDLAVLDEEWDSGYFSMLTDDESGYSYFSYTFGVLIPEASDVGFGMGICAFVFVFVRRKFRR